MRRVKLTGEEKAIERSLVRGEYVSASAAELKHIARTIIRRRKDTVISIRINQELLNGLKRKAKRYGVPYQSFISEILQRYAE